ncbi:hypothetical protein EI555_012484, partial [Monodon monoceros]
QQREKSQDLLRLNERPSCQVCEEDPPEPPPTARPALPRPAPPHPCCPPGAQMRMTGKLTSGEGEPREECHVSSGVKLEVRGHAPDTPNPHSLRKEAATQAPPTPPLLSAPEARAWLLGPKSIRFPGGVSGKEDLALRLLDPGSAHCRDPLTRKVTMLVQFLLEKYKTKEPILQAALLKAVNRKYQKHFPEILSRASEIMEVIFGLELKEVDPSNHSYALISKMALPSEGSPSDESGLPTPGLLMILLGLIFKKGNRATEEEIWEFLSGLDFYAGMRHLISGEPRRLISKDFVQQKYL